VEYQLGVQRFDELSIGVQFGAELMDIPDLKAIVIYRMMFRIKDTAPEAADPEAAFRPAIARLAPLAMLPFVRETLVSVFQRALLPSHVLPITYVGGMWSPESIELPPPPEIHTPND
jgi:hypothetical protein